MKKCYVVFTCCALTGALFAGTAHAVSSKDGAATISSAVQLNYYSPLVGASATGPLTIEVANIGQLADSSGLCASPSLSAGDSIMIYQAQGATISTVDSSAFGAVSSYGSAGHYELYEVESFVGNVISLGEGGPACAAESLINSYNSAHVIRVPQFTDLTITSGGSITAALSLASGNSEVITVTATVQ